MKNRYTVEGSCLWIEMWGWRKKKGGREKLRCAVSMRDFERVNSIPGTWYAMEAKAPAGKFYAQAKVWDKEAQRSNTVLMHRFILRPPRGMDTHHVDNDGLNNRRENLEIVTHAANLRAHKPVLYWDAVDAKRAKRAENAKVLAACREIRRRTGLSRQMIWAVREGKKTSRFLEPLLRQYGLLPALPEEAVPSMVPRRPIKAVVPFARHIPCSVCGVVRCTEPHGGPCPVLVGKGGAGEEVGGKIKCRMTAEKPV